MFRSVVIFLVLILVFPCSLNAAASDPDGKKASEKDVRILSEKGIIDDAIGFNTRESYQVKMLFLTQKGIDDYGSLTLQYAKRNENISDIKGTVYRPNGETVDITGKDIFRKNIQSDWGKKMVQITVVFPSLEVGASVEYFYSRSSTESKKTNRWAFQNELFTEHSEVTFVPAQGYRWGYSITNPLAEPEFHKTVVRGNSGTTIVRENIPPLPREAFSLPYDSQVESVLFYYFDFSSKSDNFWEKGAAHYYKEVLKSFAKPCSRSKEIVKEQSLSGEGDEWIKLMKAYAYVQNNYIPVSHMTKEEESLFDDNSLEKLYRSYGVNDFFKFKYQTDRSITFLLASLLATALPEATIGFAYNIPWHDGLFDPKVQTFAQFGELMLFVRAGSYTTWLSPSLRYLTPNALPFGVKGTSVLVCDKDGGRFEKIRLDKAGDNQSTSTLDVSFRDDKVVIDRTMVLDQYESYAMRTNLLYYPTGERKDIREGDLRTAFHQELSLLEVTFQDLADTGKPLTIIEKFTFPYSFEEAGDQVLFRFPGIKRTENNPLDVDKRMGTIVFPYAFHDTTTATYHLPESMKVVSLPKDSRINEKILLYKMDYRKSDERTFTMTMEKTLEGSMMSKDAFPYLKNTYNLIMESNRQVAVLKKE